MDPLLAAMSGILLVLAIEGALWWLFRRKVLSFPSPELSGMSFDRFYRLHFAHALAVSHAIILSVAVSLFLLSAW
ncbi:MAG: hypothetical protein PHW10_04695 [Candidatus Peribacteraceae bacterium]|nr:hypothetical protein [Candidatus Peribacteraceae bacterium]